MNNFFNHQLIITTLQKIVDEKVWFAILFLLQLQFNTNDNDVNSDQTANSFSIYFTFLELAIFKLLLFYFFFQFIVSIHSSWKYFSLSFCSFFLLSIFSTFLCSIIRFFLPFLPPILKVNLLNSTRRERKLIENRFAGEADVDVELMQSKVDYSVWL